MPGDTCIVCANTWAKDPTVSMHCFPKKKMKKPRWLKALELKDDDVGHHHLVYEVGIFQKATPNRKILN